MAIDYCADFTRACAVWGCMGRCPGEERQCTAVPTNVFLWSDRRGR
ncbi:hypothetical protein RRSWK_06257 [Rhodopirellula sp. SWK7]|nr:hypothetical protein RRSWK_06257 [Rhodopirellula sp. SWK7]